MFRLAVFVGSPGLAFVANLLLVHLYGDADFGRVTFYIAIATMMFALFFGGYATLLARSFQEHIAEANSHSDFAKSITNIKTVALVLLFFFLITSFYDPMASFSIGVVLLALVCTRTLSAILRGARQNLMSICVDPGVRPLFVFVTALVFFYVGRDNAKIEWLFVIAFPLCIVTSIMIAMRSGYHRFVKLKSGHIFHSEVLRANVIVSIIGLVQVWVINMDVVMIGLLSGSADIADYKIASQYCAFLPVLQVLFNHSNMLTYKGIEHADTDLRRSAEVALRANSVRSSLVAAGMGGVGYVLFYTGILGFDVDLSVYSVLAFTAVINCLLGSAGSLLLVNKFEANIVWCYVICLILNVVLNWFLIGEFGALGACVATMVAVIFLNFSNLIIAKRSVGLSVSMLFRAKLS